MDFDATAIEFSQALKMIKEGHIVCREGWHDPSMFLYLVPQSIYPSFTEVAKREFGDSVQYGAYIAIRTHLGNVVPWQPTNTDILSDDWKVIK